MGPAQRKPECCPLRPALLPLLPMHRWLEGGGRRLLPAMLRTEVDSGQPCLERLQPARLSSCSQGLVSPPSPTRGEGTGRQLALAVGLCPCHPPCERKVLLVRFVEGATGGLAVCPFPESTSKEKADRGPEHIVCLAQCPHLCLTFSQGVESLGVPPEEHPNS